MQGYNCIMVFNKEGDKLLFCKRTKDPYLGKYNLVGGKSNRGKIIFMRHTGNCRRKPA